MDLITYQNIVEALLRTHYGLDIDCTRFYIPDVIQSEMDAGIEPYEAVSAFAEKYELDRVDSPQRPFVYSAALMKEDQDKIISSMGANTIDQPNASVILKL